ncbi:hypothetical protein Pan189_19340 [Stratiformator vulcanicus]|uniref:Uncharacterized protein n=1 Tax=Stratiformator vulcanicus TaxID=2527980 RepID=A0A517R146_9PLAN|nr:hypothetical protein Pan189_19340 [Stratiformator vulcanicus]
MQCVEYVSHLLEVVCVFCVEFELRLQKVEFFC